jgi:hypothetical protein
MNPIIEHIVEKNLLIHVMVIGGGLTIAAISIVCSTFRTICISRSREQTKRELAAYVAEGSLDPDKALAMINAGKKSGDSGSACC